MKFVFIDDDKLIPIEEWEKGRELCPKCSALGVTKQGNDSILSCSRCGFEFQRKFDSRTVHSQRK